MSEITPQTGFPIDLITDGGNAKINTKDFPDINAISGVLKLYLRQLPIPLVPFDLFGAFMDAVRKFVYLE